MTKYNTVNLEIFGTYCYPKVKGVYYHPRIFRVYKNSRKKEIMAYTYGYINKAAIIILNSPQNPEFKINFSSGPEEEQFEFLLKKFNKEKQDYFEYSGKLGPQFQACLIKYLTDRNFINQIKKYEKQARKIRKELEKREPIVNKLKRQEEAIWKKIYASDRKVSKLEAHLFAASQ